VKERKRDASTESQRFRTRARIPKVEIYTH
jgi:hypothetical protein